MSASGSAAAVCGFAQGSALILANYSASLSYLWGAFKRHAGSAPEAVFALAVVPPGGVQTPRRLCAGGGVPPRRLCAGGGVRERLRLGRLFLVLLVCFVRSLGLFLLLV